MTQAELDAIMVIISEHVKGVEKGVLRTFDRYNAKVLARIKQLTVALIEIEAMAEGPAQADPYAWAELIAKAARAARLGVPNTQNPQPNTPVSPSPEPSVPSVAKDKS